MKKRTLRPLAGLLVALVVTSQFAPTAMAGERRSSRGAACASEKPQEETSSNEASAASRCRALPAPRTSRGVAVAASVVPGVLVHGTGSYLRGDEEAASRLLWLELIGLGASAVSLTGLAVTGAARSTVTPLAAGLVGGVGLFGLSWLADIYHTASPEPGYGTPRTVLPLLESQVGYVYVNDPQFSYNHFVYHGAVFRPNRVSVGYQAWHAPTEESARYRVAAGYRFWGAAGPRAAEFTDGSFLELRTAGTYQRFLEEEFDTATAELSLNARVDVERVLPTVRGGFTEFQLGYGLRFTDFRRLRPEQSLGERVFFGDQQDDLLLARFAFGFYLGDPVERGGEFQLFYDHRHDGFDAGLKAAGVGSGVGGHFGLNSFYYITQHYGLELSASVGSAWVLGASLRTRVGNK